MAASSIALSQSRPLSSSRRILELVPGLLLLFVIGYAGKFLEQIHRSHCQGPSLGHPQHRICAVGDRHRPGHLQHNRSTRNLPRWRGHL